MIWNSSQESWSLHLFTYLISMDSYGQYGLVNIYIILWVTIKSCFIYFVAHIVPALATGNSFNWLLRPFDRLLPCCCCWLKKFFWPLPYLLAEQDAPGAACRFSAAVHFPKETSFHWRTVLKTRAQCQRRSPCSWRLFLSPLSWHSKEITCMYTNPHIYRYLYVFFSLHLSLYQAHRGFIEVA